MVFETAPYAGAVRARPAAGRIDRQFTGKIGGIRRFRNESSAKQQQSGDDGRCSTKHPQIRSPRSRFFLKEMDQPARPRITLAARISAFRTVARPSHFNLRIRLMTPMAGPGGRALAAG
jgi:hypothetical protein